MRRPSLYSLISADLSVIARAIFKTEDHGAEVAFDDIRDQLRRLAEGCKEREKTLKEERRQESRRHVAARG